jgi:hypothetical protein
VQHKFCKNTVVLFLLSAGYIAVSKPLGKEEKRDIVVVFRGTQAKTEWASDFVWEMQPWDELKKGRDAVKIAKASSLICLIDPKWREQLFCDDMIDTFFTLETRHSCRCEGCVSLDGYSFRKAMDFVQFFFSMHGIAFTL